MNTGVLFDDKVLCPWHAAGFSVTSGALERGPGIDSLPNYEVHEKNGKWFVRVPKTLKHSEIANMAKRDPNNKTKMLIIGGGASGISCAETLRQSNFTGEIQVISNEKQLPYDRTLLSKCVATGDASKFSLRDSGFLDTYGIDYQLGYTVRSIDRHSKQVVLSDGQRLSYDKLLIATGGSARVPRNEGMTLNGVHVLRSGADQGAIKEAASKANNIVVIGGGFIASECTANLAKTFNGKKSVSLVFDTNVPLELVYGYDVGGMLLTEHERNGTDTYPNRDLSKFRYVGDENGNVKKVVMDNGYELKADLVVVGAGMIPNTEIARDCGLDMDANGGVKTNPFLQTSDDSIFAAGDIASVPSWQTGDYQRIEHWVVAQDQGAYAAFNMLGKMEAYGSIPFFWTNHYGKGMQYVGHATKWDEIHIDGVPRSNKFIAYYIHNNKVLAASGQGRGKDLFTVFEAMNQNVLPSADQIKSGAENFETITKKLVINKGGACRRANCCQKKNLVQ